MLNLPCAILFLPTPPFFNTLLLIASAISETKCIHMSVMAQTLHTHPVMILSKASFHILLKYVPPSL